MDTLLEVLKKTTAFFEGKGIESPRLDAELLFAHVLNCSRLDLYLEFDKPMSAKLLDELRPLVARRGKREPLQYLLGEVPFCGLTLKVDSRALIPRPETEELVELLVQQKVEPKRILDLGTGTGALALALANQYSAAAVVAVERSSEARSLAHENAQQNNLLEQLTLLEGSWFESVTGTFDLIVSNPPYLTQEEWEAASPEVKHADPYEALVSPEEGIADLLHILSEARSYLDEGACLALETGIAHHERLKQEAEALGYSKTDSFEDLNKRDRFFLAWN